MNASRTKNLQWFFSLIALSFCVSLNAQYSITGTGSGNTYTQNFDGFLGTSITVPTNWTVTSSNAYNGVYTRTNAYVNSNRIVALRDNTGSTDYALGVKVAANSGTCSATGTMTADFLVTNNTGVTINQFVINWSVEQYSQGLRATTNDFSYKIGSGSFVQTNITGTTLTTASTGTPDQNLSSIAATSQSITISNLSIANGTSVTFRYTFCTGSGSGNNCHLGIDDFSVYAVSIPTIAINGAHPSVSNFALGSTNNIVGSYKLDVSNVSATLTDISVPTMGTYQLNDIQSNGFKFWINSINSWSGATQLGSDQAVEASGQSVGVSGLSQVIDVGTSYILFTADISATAVNGRTIGVNTATVSNFTFSAGTKTGTPGASGLSSLPIKLISFSATRQNNQAQLTFSTATEENNDFFAIERSGNGTDFRTIGKVNGAGTTTSIQNYTFTDETPLSGINYYRLKQVDFDGQFSYSPVVNVVFDNKAGIRLAPSPVQDQLRVELDEMFQDDAQWQLYDFAGRLVQTGVLSAENTVFNVEVGSLTPGNYVIRVVSGQTTLTKQFQK